MITLAVSCGSEMNNLICLSVQQLDENTCRNRNRYVQEFTF